MRKVGIRAILGTLVCMFMAATLAAQPAAAKKPKDKEICRPGDNGDEVCFRLPRTDNPNSTSLLDRYLYGLKSPRGKTLLKPQYTTLNVHSAHLAVAGDASGQRIFDIDKRKFLPEVWNNISTTIGYYKQEYMGSWWVGSGPDARSDCSDIAILDDADGHVLNRIEGACEWTAYGKVLIVDFHTPEGETVSRLYNEIGEAVSPFLPQIVYKSEAGNNNKYYLMVLGRLPIEGLMDQRVYRPIGIGGEPLALPEGAVGLLNLTTFEEDPGEFSDQFSSGWAIIYPTPDGQEYAVGEGTAEEVLAQAPDLDRYTSIQNIEFYRNQAREKTYLIGLQDRDSGMWTALEFNLDYTDDPRALRPYLPSSDGLPGFGGMFPSISAMIQGIHDLKECGARCWRSGRLRPKR